MLPELKTCRACPCFRGCRRTEESNANGVNSTRLLQILVGQLCALEVFVQTWSLIKTERHHFYRTEIRPDGSWKCPHIVGVLLEQLVRHRFHLSFSVYDVWPLLAKPTLQDWIRANRRKKIERSFVRASEESSSSVFCVTDCGVRVLDPRSRYFKTWELKIHVCHGMRCA